MLGSGIVPYTSLTKKTALAPLPRGLNIAFDGEKSAKNSRLKVEVNQNHTSIAAPSLLSPYNEKESYLCPCLPQSQTFHLRSATTTVIRLIIP